MKYYCATLLFLFSMYACSFGGKPYDPKVRRDTRKIFWVRCIDSKELWAQAKNEDPNPKDWACLRRCKERKKVTRSCKEYETLSRKMSDSFFTGFILIPENEVF